MVERNRLGIYIDRAINFTMVGGLNWGRLAEHLFTALSVFAIEFNTSIMTIIKQHGKQEIKASIVIFHCHISFS